MNQNQVGFLFYLRLHRKKQTNKKQPKTGQTKQHKYKEKVIPWPISRLPWNTSEKHIRSLSDDV